MPQGVPIATTIPDVNRGLQLCTSLTGNGLILRPSARDSWDQKVSVECRLVFMIDSFSDWFIDWLTVNAYINAAEDQTEPCQRDMMPHSFRRVTGDLLYACANIPLPLIDLHQLWGTGWEGHWPGPSTQHFDSGCPSTMGRAGLVAQLRIEPGTPAQEPNILPT